MHVTITTLSAALCGLTALSLVGCDAHALTARLPGASTASSAPAGAAPATGPAAPAAAMQAAPPGAGSSQQDGDAADAAARERAREKGCDEPGGCYYGVRLVGYPIEEAKRRAIAFGFKGEFAVDDSYTQTGCKAGTVCSIAPANWPVLGDDLTFYVTYAPRELKINKPE
jgi:hypothetical protein